MAELKPCPFCGRIPNTYGCKIYGYYVVCDCGVEQSRIYKQKCDAVKHWNRRKTESNSEKPNNCEDLQDWKDKMWAEAIVTEPITQTETQNLNLTFEKRCKWCKHYKLTCDLFSEICKYEPKDEPTISKMEQVEDELQTERSE